MHEDDLPRCLTCGYILRGLMAHRCPECGRAFDPNDPTTFDNASQAILRIRRALTIHDHCVVGLFVIVLITLYHFMGQNAGLAIWTPLIGLLFLSLFAILLLAALRMLYTAANQVRGRGYAAGHIVLALIMLPVFGAGLFFVRIVIEMDAAKIFGDAWRSQEVE